MITADQIVVHLIGDYITQSHWMATTKTKHWFPAFCHAWMYTGGFGFLTVSIPALLVIMITHYFIDRYRLASYLVWLKNYLLSPPDISFEYPSFKECEPTGFPSSTPIWLSTWLLIVVDNILHILINGLAIRYM